MHNAAIICSLLVRLTTFEATANKCLLKMNMNEMKKSFPVVIRGLVVAREKLDSSNRHESFKLTIQIKKIVKGELKLEPLSATETHQTGITWSKPYYYQVGKEYVFPISSENKNEPYEIFLQRDGCPEFPKADQID